MFFLATADADGRPTCSYKGGEPGFVRVLDEHTLAFPNYDGNGMYLSTGNVLANPAVGLLFLDLERGHRMRLEGDATIDVDDPLTGEYPEAQFVVRVRARAVYPNCPRYIHRYELVRRSRFVPQEDCLTPVPEWKRSDWAFDALPADDPARDPGDRDVTGGARPPRRPDPALARVPDRISRSGSAVLLAHRRCSACWGLYLGAASGWANSFYSAAVQAGSESWKAFFFGSSDAASSITVDKTPLSLWPMALSVRLFGLSSWSILVPQALMGVATVGLLHHVVRRTTGSAAAGLIAGAVMALTPVAVLMFRFNNPDALLTLLLVGAARRDPARHRVERGRARPPGPLARPRRRPGRARLPRPRCCRRSWCCRRSRWPTCCSRSIPLGQAASATCSSPSARCCWPAAGGSRSSSCGRPSSRPTSAARRTTRSSSSPSATTASAGSAATRPARSAAADGGWGATGLLRLFNSEIGGQIAWLLPAALVLGVGRALVRPRGDRPPARRAHPLAGLAAWSPALTFSFMAGIFHAYYTVALAPGRSPRSSASAPGCCGSTATSLRRLGVLAFSDGAHLGARRGTCSTGSTDFAAVAEVASSWSSGWSRRPRCSPGPRTCRAGSRVAAAAAAAGGHAGRPGGVRRQHRRHRRTPARSPAPVRPRHGRPGRHAGGGQRGGQLGTPPGHGTAAGAQADRHRRSAAAPAACSTAARRRAEVTALLQDRRRRRTPGRPRPSARTTRPATSSPARSR